MAGETLRGNMRKMVTRLEAPVSYTLPLSEQRIEINPLIGKKIRLTYLQEINCIHCGRKTNKSFGQGYCYPCFRDLPECDNCIVRPETCHFDAGTCRDPAWGLAQCFQDHFVYLANSSGVKVGITRGSQVPTRWMDQGATQALPIFRVKSRLQSGLVEVAIKQHVADKTDWRKMLKGDNGDVCLKTARDELFEKSAAQIAELRDRFGEQAIAALPNAEVVEIRYPVEVYPEKIKSLNLDKESTIDSILQGVKGQYLIFDCGVINIRKYGGYLVELSAEGI